MKVLLRVTLIILAILGLFVSCKNNEQPNKPNEFTINYSAIILNQDNEPIVNAIASIVNLNNTQTIATDTSDTDGKISFENIKVATDDLKMIISHNSYKTKIIKYNDWGKESSNKIFLDKKEDDCCGKIEVKVINQDGKDLEGVLVQVRQEMKELQKAKTNSDGIVNFDSLCLEEYELRLSLEGYKVIEKIINVEDCDKTLEIKFTMNKLESEEDTCCKGVLKFIPKDKDGNVLNGTKIYIKQDGQVIEDPVVKEGKAVVDGLCEGKYTIVYKKDGFKNKEIHIELGCNETKTLDTVLEKEETDCCKGLVKVIVKDDNGNLVKNATVRIWKGTDKLEELKTNDKGQVIFDGLCEGGNYSISIITEDYEGFEFEFDLACKEELSFEKTLTLKDECCDAILKFIVMDKANKTALKDAEITLKLNGKVVYEGKLTDQDGIYIAKELCKGKYTVIIKKDGYKTIETHWKVEKCDDFQEHFWMEK